MSLVQVDIRKLEGKPIEGIYAQVLSADKLKESPAMLRKLRRVYQHKEHGKHWICVEWIPEEELICFNGDLFSKGYYIQILKQDYKKLFP